MAIVRETAVLEDLAIQSSSTKTKAVTTPSGGSQAGTLLGLHSWINSLYNIRQWGAHPSNTGAVNKTAIQAALDQAETDGGGGIVCPFGEYLTDGVLTVPSGLWIVALGRAIFKLDDSVNEKVLVLDDGSDLTTIIGLEIDGNKANNGTGSVGIETGGTSNRIRLLDIYVHDCKTIGVALTDTTKFSTVRGILKDNGTYGLDEGDSCDENLIDILADGNTTSPVNTVGGSTRVRIAGNDALDDLDDIAAASFMR